MCWYKHQVLNLYHTGVKPFRNPLLQSCFFCWTQSMARHILRNRHIFRLFSRYRVRIKFVLIAFIADFVRSLRSSTQCRNFLVRGSVSQSAWCFTPQLISQSYRKIKAKNILTSFFNFRPGSSKRNEGTNRAYDVEYPFSRGLNFVHYDSHNRLP